MTQPLSQRLERMITVGALESCCPECDAKNSAALKEAYELAKRVESAATGQVVEVGNLPVYEDEDGNSAFTGYLIQATPTEIRDAPPIIYKRVALVTMEEP